ncbi:MAG: hypothetical protein IID30_09525 [Planctomycetes bacterium]|nr:hypothetical protein [Planctomycetota bacterium]
MRFNKTKAQYRQEIVAKYRAAGETWPTDSKTIASWAVRNKQWEMPRRDAINVCAKELSEAMREEYFFDPQDRRVRKKHCLRKREELADGTHKQMVIWLDIEDDADRRDDIEEAFQQRRTMVLTDCRHLKTDLDSYNDNGNPGLPIQMIFDFTEDLTESEQPIEYEGITA